MARFVVTENGGFLEIEPEDLGLGSDFSEYDFPELDEAERQRYKELQSVIKNIEEREKPVAKLKTGEIEKVYKNQLNQAQAEAVFATDGPVLVIAGAGSGKTRSLIGRLSYLHLVKNIPLSRIELLTFTRSATRNMQNAGTI